MFHLTTALDAASAVPLYEQLYQSLAAEMRAGAIPAGTRMPGKRRLAAELSVSVNTVDAAYQILAAEGYLEPKERSGAWAARWCWNFCSTIWSSRSTSWKSGKKFISTTCWTCSDRLRAGLKTGAGLRIMDMEPGTAVPQRRTSGGKSRWNLHRSWKTAIPAKTSVAVRWRRKSCRSFWKQAGWPPLRKIYRSSGSMSSSPKRG